MAFDEKGNWINLEYEIRANPNYKPQEQQYVPIETFDYEHNPNYKEMGQQYVPIETFDYEHNPNYKENDSSNPIMDNNEKLEDNIKNGKITTKEDKELVVKTTLYGTRKGKNLTDRINAIKDDPEMITKLLKNQQEIAIEDMKRNSPRYDGVDRQYQFMKTLVILKEQGYDFSKLQFGNEEKPKDFMKFMAEYTEELRANKDKMDIPISSPIIPERIKDSPLLISNEFIKDEYLKNPNKVNQEYEAYVQSKGNSNFILTKEEFVNGRYGIDIPNPESKLNAFMEARKAQQEIDKAERQEIINGIQQEAPDLGGPRR